MIRHSYLDRTDDGKNIYRVVTSEGRVWEAGRGGNVTRRREHLPTEAMGEKIQFEEMPLSVQKQIMKAMGVAPLVRMWYLYSPVDSFTDNS